MAFWTLSTRLDAPRRGSLPLSGTWSLAYVINADPPSTVHELPWRLWTGDGAGERGGVADGGDVVEGADRNYSVVVADVVVVEDERLAGGVVTDGAGCPPKSLNDSCSGSWARSEAVPALSWRDPRTVVPPKVMSTERSVDTDASSVRAGPSAVGVGNGDGGAVVAVDGSAPFHRLRK